MASPSVRKVIKRFKDALSKESFPKAKAYLFGSYARGDAFPDSDIDVCLVSPSFRTGKKKYEKEAIFIAYHVDPRLHVVLADPHKFKKDKLSPLFSRIRKEAKAA